MKTLFKYHYIWWKCLWKFVLYLLTSWITSISSKHLFRTCMAKRIPRTVYFILLQSVYVPCYDYGSKTNRVFLKMFWATYIVTSLIHHHPSHKSSSLSCLIMPVCFNCSPGQGYFKKFFKCFWFLCVHTLL